MNEKMPPDVRRKLFDIRCRSKRGEYLSEEERKLISLCWSRWPEDYRAMEAEVFEETKPFGATR